MTTSAPITVDSIGRHILLIRGYRVLLDHDLAAIYGVTPKRLKEQVRRNTRRFPQDFMFQLSDAEKREVAAKCGNLRKLKFAPVPPLAFTEHGAIMVATVLSSERAVAVSVLVVRAFVQLRQLAASHAGLAVKLAALERQLGSHDKAIVRLFVAIRHLMATPEPRKRPIGFTADIT